MPNLASITIIGHLGRDPETRDAGSTTVASWSMAVTIKRRGEDHTTWYNVGAFGKLGELCQRYLRKGAPVLVIGEFLPREYETRDGEARISYDITAREVQFLGSKSDSAGHDESPPRSEEEALPF